MKRSNTLLVLGLILLVAGAAVLVYGIISYNSVRGTLGNAVGKLFTGRSAAEDQAMIEMIAGGAAALLGLVFLIVPRRGRR
jgi:hypothetical protein